MFQRIISVLICLSALIRPLSRVQVSLPPSNNSITVLPSYAQIPGSASPTPAGCWLQLDPETGSRAEAEGAERWWSLEHKQT